MIMKNNPKKPTIHEKKKIFSKQPKTLIILKDQTQIAQEWRNSKLPLRGEKNPKT